MSILYASSEPHKGAWRFHFPRDSDKIEITPENAAVKVVQGHMYLLHAKDVNDKKEINKDLYVMFRVEALKSNDEVTISWKVVPSPENQ